MGFILGNNMVWLWETFHIRLLHLRPVLGLKRAYSRAGSQKDRRTDVEWGRPRMNTAQEAELKWYQFLRPMSLQLWWFWWPVGESGILHHRAKHALGPGCEKPMEGLVRGRGAESPKQPRPTSRASRSATTCTYIKHPSMKRSRLLLHTHIPGLKQSHMAQNYAGKENLEKVVLA